MYNGQLGIALIAFNRPEYFEKLIDSLEKQTHLACTDFHLFSDGQVNKFSGRKITKQAKINKVRELFWESSLPNKSSTEREQNVGNGINQFEAVEYMADNYKHFLVLEDDIKLSPHYLRLARIGINTIIKDESIFSFNLGFLRHCNEKELHDNLNKIIHKGTHWFGEVWSSDNWQKVRRDYLTYFQFIQSVEYAQRPSKLITRFFRSQGFNIPQTSQDAGKDYALFKNNLQRATTVVNRGFYLGRRGLHFRPDIYERYGFDKAVPYIFESDSELSEFVIK